MTIVQAYEQVEMLLGVHRIVAKVFVWALFEYDNAQRFPPPPDWPGPTPQGKALDEYVLARFRSITVDGRISPLASVSLHDVRGLITRWNAAPASSKASIVVALEGAAARGES